MGLNDCYIIFICYDICLIERYGNLYTNYYSSTYCLYMSNSKAEQEILINIIAIRMREKCIVHTLKIQNSFFF